MLQPVRGAREQLEFVRVERFGARAPGQPVVQLTEQLVVGAALAINTVIAVSIGGTVPLILKRFKFDPAVASGPLLTTVTDMCGFFLVLSLASLVLPAIS